MFPVSTTDIIRTEQSHRLEGYRRWSRRSHDGTDASTPRDAGTRDATGHGPRRPLRLAFGR